jgi:hypothetical protein
MSLDVSGPQRMITGERHRREACGLDAMRPKVETRGRRSPH